MGALLIAVGGFAHRGNRVEQFLSLVRPFQARKRR
jgi:hypothetical protein